MTASSVVQFAELSLLRATLTQRLRSVRLRAGSRLRMKPPYRVRLQTWSSSTRDPLLSLDLVWLADRSLAPVSCLAPTPLHKSSLRSLPRRFVGEPSLATARNDAPPQDRSPNRPLNRSACDWRLMSLAKQQRVRRSNPLLRARQPSPAMNPENPLLLWSPRRESMLAWVAENCSREPRAVHRRWFCSWRIARGLLLLLDCWGVDTDSRLRSRLEVLWRSDQ